MLVFARDLFWVFWFPIDIFVNGKIETLLKSHCVVKLPVDERYNNFRARFSFSTPNHGES